MLDWSKYIAIAEKFQHKAKRQDRGDLNHNIIISLPLRKASPTSWVSSPTLLLSSPEAGEKTYLIG